MLSKPCAVCLARSCSKCDIDGKSDSSRSSSRRGSSNIICSSGGGSRKNSGTVAHFHLGGADSTSAPVCVTHHNSPVALSPDKPSIPGPTIIAASLRAVTRRNVAVQAHGCLLQAGEDLVASGRELLQVTVSVKDR